MKAQLAPQGESSMPGLLARTAGLPYAVHVMNI